MKLALLDVETTGGSPVEDRIIDIGIVLVDDYNVVKEWESLVNPERPINPFISRLTGITNTDVSNAPIFADIHTVIDELLDDRIFVAHNVRFDYAFVKHEFARLSKPFHPDHACSVKLSRTLFPQFRKHNLDSIIERFSLTVDNRHRALPDAKAIYSFIQTSCSKKGIDKVTAEISKQIRHPSLPTLLSFDDIYKLPPTVGVYLFYDKEGTPLYIGKSINIRERVMSHFYDDIHSLREMKISQTVAHIEAKTCAGELEALIIESRLVKELMPIYNRQLRQTKGIWVIKSSTDNHGYVKLEIENMHSMTYEDHDSIYAVFRTKRQLMNKLDELQKEYELCPKLCGLEKGKDACFSSHLGACHGACTGKEPVADYNQRVLEAFDGTGISDWPYDGPIVIHERNESLEIDAYHLIHNWTIVKTVRFLEDIDDFIHPVSSEISLDEYKILKLFLTKSTARSRHFELIQNIRR